MIQQYHQQQQQQLQLQQTLKQVSTTTSQETKPRPHGILRNAQNYQKQQYQQQQQQQTVQLQQQQLQQLQIQKQKLQQQQQQQIQQQLQQKPQSILKQQHQLIQPQMNFSQDSDKQKYLSATVARKQQQQQLSVSQTTTLPRNTNDYVRELWPLAPPPASKLEECVRPDSRCEIARSSLFLYGDSVTLNSATAPNNRRSDHDDTHIYETPKYLRKEKAATMRLQPKNQKSLQFQKNDNSDQAGNNPILSNVEHDFRSTKTLPKKVLTSTDSVKL